MNTLTTAERWDPVHRMLHWGMAGLLVLQWIAGAFDDLFGGRGFHLSLGITLFALLLFRLAWRLSHAAPPQPAGTPPWAHAAAAAVHWGWYVLLIALPVTGLIMRQAKGKIVSWFGLVDLPSLFEVNKQLSKQMEEWHEGLAWIAVALLVVHAAAALKHHYLDRDAVLRRMW